MARNPNQEMQQTPAYTPDMRAMKMEDFPGMSRVDMSVKGPITQGQLRERPGSGEPLFPGSEAKDAHDDMKVSDRFAQALAAGLPVGNDGPVPDDPSHDFDP